MVKDKLYTIEFAAQTLLKRGLISHEQHKELLSKGNSRRASLQKSQDSSYSKRHHYAHHVTHGNAINFIK